MILCLPALNSSNAQAGANRGAAIYISGFYPSSDKLLVKEVESDLLFITDFTLPPRGISGLALISRCSSLNLDSLMFVDREFLL
jgi:hypothetical protein